ncbi:hypothetical protein GCM10017584_35460 [Leifsonia poae]|uniref:Uncharacterized protein n=1 Tax=Leifsonia poae TaxID=110933 RepID=A0A9W6M1P4_9MICO|nr:hypothetical protein GCM10017584_35460 [Leifsonia poae]
MREKIERWSVSILSILEFGSVIGGRSGQWAQAMAGTVRDRRNGAVGRVVAGVARSNAVIPWV